VIPHDHRLRVHYLRSHLEGLHAAGVTWRVRLILTLDEEAQQVTLLEVGTHDEVYR
jgi:mRNA-degrading endonuclease YafQ of YafQ-DinJ toxin-antitoxin module